MTETHKTNTFVLLMFLNQIFWMLFWEPIVTFFQLGTMTQMAATQFLIFILPAAAYFMITKVSIKKTLRLKPLGIKNIVLIILMSIAVQPFMSVLSIITSFLFPNKVSNMLADTNQTNLLVLLLILAVIPAICEEVFFRGITLSGYKNQSVPKACLITGFLFGLMHMDGQQFLYAFLIGTLFCYLVYRTNSIFASMLAHFTINATQVCLGAQAFQNVAQSIEPIPTLPDSLSFLLLVSGTLFLLTLPLLIWVFWLFLKNNPVVSTSENTEYHPLCKERILDASFFSILIIYFIIVLIIPLFR